MIGSKLVRDFKDFRSVGILPAWLGSAAGLIALLVIVAFGVWYVTQRTIASDFNAANAYYAEVIRAKNRIKLVEDSQKLSELRAIIRVQQIEIDKLTEMALKAGKTFAPDVLFTPEEAKKLKGK